MSDESQLDRIEKKLDDVITASSRHGADIAWLKRIVGGLGAGVVAIGAQFLRKMGL